MATVYLADDLKHLRALAVNVLLLLTVLSGCSPPSQDAGRWELVHTLLGHTGNVSSVAFSPDGQTVVSGSWDGSIKLWDRMTGAEVATYYRHTASHWYRAIAYTPDGNRLVAASSDSTAKLLKASSGELIAVLSGHEGQVSSVAFAPEPCGSALQPLMRSRESSRVTRQRSCLCSSLLTDECSRHPATSTW